MAYVNRFGHTTCENCKKIHMKGEYFPYCSWDCRYISIPDNPYLKNKECKRCGNTFNTINGGRIFCSDVCKYKKKRERKTETQKAKVQNKKWEKDENFSALMKKHKKIPLEVLNKMAERKRVMDDSGWDHYLRGRKWDRI